MIFNQRLKGVLCRFCAGVGSSYPLLMPAMVEPAGVSQVEECWSVIVLIAEAWRLD